MQRCLCPAGWRKKGVQKMTADIFSMEGRTVVFTGGCGNLGRVMVRSLLEYGANVAVLARTDRLDDGFRAARERGSLAVIETDLRSTESTRAGFARAQAIFGGIDVLVNCAAYGGGAGGKSCEYRLERVPDETWEEGIDGTLNVTFRCIREVLPYFEKRGKGNIVNIASMCGLISPDFDVYGENIPWNPPTYGAGKAGVLQLTRYCAAALARRNIRVNSLTPGAFPKLGPDTDQAFVERLQNKIMLKRTGRPEELCGALILLCSDASSFMTAANLVVDGGMTQW